MHALTIGFGLGFLVALQLGPMSLFLVRSTLRGGWRSGSAIGAGIALVDALYAALRGGRRRVAARDRSAADVVALLGAAVLLALGRGLCATPSGCGSAPRPATRSPRRAARSPRRSPPRPPTRPRSPRGRRSSPPRPARARPTRRPPRHRRRRRQPLLGDLLATGTAAARRASGPRAMRIADAIAGAGLIAFGCALAAGAGRRRQARPCAAGRSGN